MPKQALIYEGDQVRVWVAHEDKSIELRQVKTGLTNGNLVEVAGDLRPGEKIVTKGSLFIDRAASGSWELNGSPCRFCRQPPLLMVGLLALVIVGGVIAFKQLNIEAYPDPTPPMVDVVTQSPGPVG